MTLETLGTAVIYSDILPFEWGSTHDLNEEGIARLNFENDECLRHLLLLDDYLQEGGDEDEVYPGLARIELKVNLLLDLMGQLLARQTLFPPKKSVRIAGTGIEWIDQSINDDFPILNQLGVIKIYLNSSYPRCLKLPCKIASYSVESEGNKLVGTFEHINQGVRSQLEKWIFRRHRRVIAQERRNT